MKTRRKIRKSLTFNILFIAVVIIYFSTVIHMMRNLYKESYQGLESSIDVLEESTGDRLRTIDKLYYALELSMDEKMHENLILMNEAYNQGELTDEFLFQLRQENPDMHFYVIDENHIIVQSTLETDLGLDFSFAPDFCIYLDDIRKENSYTRERVSLSTVSSNINKYGYFGSSDGKYVLEVSYDMSKFEELLEKDSLSSISSATIETLPYIINLDVFNYFGKSANTGLNIEDNKTEEFIIHYKQAREIKETVSYEEKVGNHIEYTRFVPYVIENFNNTQSVYMITITYTDQYVRQALNRTLTSNAIYLIVIMFIFIFYYRYVNRRLINPLQENLEAVEKGYLDTVETLTNALEAKDNYTRGHSERVTKLSMMLGEYLNLSEKELTVLQRGSLLHDIGKIGIVDSILNKEGRFTNEEYRIIKEHPAIGYSILSKIDFLNESNNCILYHHERIDGNGYPKGLKGDEIPYFAKLLAITDAFDAMTSKRVYKKNVMLVSEAINELKRCAGTQFDEALVDQFIAAYISKYGNELECLAVELEDH